MKFSLYSATVPSYLQILHSMSGLLDKAETFCRDRQVAPDDVIQARLAADMLPFCYQVKSTAVHSLGSIEGVRAGVFRPDTTTPPDTFEALKARTSESIAALSAIDAAEIDGFVGKDVYFAFGAHRLDFKAEDFLLSFSLPNFYFHASTAYDILRWKGLQIGKRDYMGKPRLKV